MVKVDRKTARDAYVAGKSITVWKAGISDDEADIVIEFSCNRPIKDESKVRRFNRILKSFTDSEGKPQFWIGRIDDLGTAKG